MGEIPAQTRLLRNLKDAGFDEAMIQKYLQLQKEGKRQEQFRLLSLHRASRSGSCQSEYDRLSGLFGLQHEK